jgi:K+/H+ antiporter YhaU regulatory subunit KhtT
MSDDQPAARSAADRIAAAAARARGAGTATKTQAKAQGKEKVAVHHEEEAMPVVDIKEMAALELKIKDNFFHKTLTDTQLSQEEKISAIANALDPKQQSMEKVRENYQAFQEYYTYTQSEELDEALENVVRLIEEIKGNTKVEIAAILKSLQGMLNDVNESRQLIEGLRQSRITGKTIEQLADAVRRNQAVVPCPGHDTASEEGHHL